MTRAAVEQLESLLRRSFEGENTQSILQNIGDVRPDDWDWLPADGQRSIRAIFAHVAIAKHIYTAFLFSDARPSWDDVAARCPADPAAVIDWAREGHAAFMRGMATLHDADLARTTTKWHGARDTVAEVIAVMVQHDCYHAGEINHLRALHQHDDSE